MAKGYRKSIANSTKSRAPEKLERVFVDRSGPRSTHSLLGKKYVMIVKDAFTRYSWVYFLECKSNADTFRKFLADVRADSVPSKVDIVRSDNRRILWWRFRGSAQAVLHQRGIYQQKESRGKRRCR